MVTIGGVESWQSLGWYKCQSWPQDIESTQRTQVRPQDLGGPALHLAEGGAESFMKWTARLSFPF